VVHIEGYLTVEIFTAGPVSLDELRRSTGTILSVAMMLRYSLNLPKEAEAGLGAGW
jgi:hypothetical protein